MDDRAVGADSGRVPPLRAIGQGQVGGLAPSAGAAVSLVGAGVALWLLAASLLGVRVWPGGPGGGSGTLRLPASPKVAAPPARAAKPVSFRAGTPTTALPAAALAADRRRVAHRSPATPHRTDRGPAKGVTRSAPAPATSSPAPAATPVSSGGGTSGSVPSSPTPAPSGGGGGGGTDTPQPPAATPGALQQTVQTVRRTAAPVTNALPAPVQTPVNSTVGVVEQTAATVDQTLDQVTTAVAPVTDTVGRVTSGLGLGPRR
jgi:hypothetical protein